MDPFILQGKKHTYLVYQFIYEPVASNMYVILNDNIALVVDPHQSDELLKLFKKKGVERVHILLTHEHYDHTSGLKWLYDLYPTTIYCHIACSNTIAVESKNNPALVAMVLANKDKLDGGHRYTDFRRNFKPYACDADYTFEETVTWNIGDFVVEGIATPGHSPGSCFYFIDENLAFSGDTLLKDYPIVTRFKTSNLDEYKRKTLPYLKQLDRSLILIPGHGDPFEVKDAKFI